MGVESGVAQSRHSLGTQSPFWAARCSPLSPIVTAAARRSPSASSVRLPASKTKQARASLACFRLAFDTLSLAPPFFQQAQPRTVGSGARRPLASASLGQSSVVHAPAGQHMLHVVLTAEDALIVVVARRLEGLLRFRAAPGRRGEAAHHRRGTVRLSPRVRSGRDDERTSEELFFYKRVTVF